MYFNINVSTTYTRKISFLGYVWMNWCLILSTFLGIPLVIFIKEEFNRSDADEELIQDIEEQNVYSETNDAVIES